MAKQLPSLDIWLRPPLLLASSEKLQKKLLTAELLNLHSNITLNGQMSMKYDIGIPNLKW